MSIDGRLAKYLSVVVVGLAVIAVGWYTFFEVCNYLNPPSKSKSGSVDKAMKFAVCCVFEAHVGGFFVDENEFLHLLIVAEQCSCSALSDGPRVCPCEGSVGKRRMILPLCPYWSGVLAHRLQGGERIYRNNVQSHVVLEVDDSVYRIPLNDINCDSGGTLTSASYETIWRSAHVWNPSRRSPG